MGHLIDGVVAHLYLLIVGIRVGSVEAGDRLRDARDSDLARGLDALLAHFRRSHFCLDVAGVAELMLVHHFRIFI